jgi:hypothetical protein
MGSGGPWCGGDCVHDPSIIPERLAARAVPSATVKKIDLKTPARAANPETGKSGDLTAAPSYPALDAKAQTAQP